MSKKETKKEYIEIEVIDWDAVKFSLVLYPFIVMVGVIIAFAQIFKLITYIIISLIPVLNLSIMVEGNKENNIFEDYDNYEFNLKRLKKIKQIEIKRKQ